MRRRTAGVEPPIDGEDLLHGVAALRTEWRRTGGERTGTELGRAEVDGSSGVELDAQPLGFGGRVAKTVVAHGT